MDKVYHNAYANIAATFASDSSRPLFPDQSPLSFLSHKAPSPTRTPTNTASKFWWFEGDARVFTHLDEQLLYSRGWVFQERCLATRNVSFTRSQLFFECSEELSCEATDISNPSLNNTFDYPLRYLPLSIFQDSNAQQDPELFSINRLDQLTKAQCLDLWHKMVQMYSPLALSDPNDKLAALSGLARRFHSRLQTPYYAGLWSANLRSEICWARAHTKRSQRPSRANNGAVGYRAPTWSWASVDGEVEIDYRGTSSSSWSFEILEAYTTPLKGDKFAQLADGRLGLRGTMFVVREEDARANNSRKALIFLNPPTRQPLYCYWDIDGYEVTFPFYAFILRSRVDRLSDKFEIHCLVLTPVTPSRGVYRRVGMGHLSNYGIDSPPTLLPEVAQLAEADAEQRLKELEETEEFWGYMKKNGAGVHRHHNNKESALDVLSRFVPQELNVEPEVIKLAIQTELADDHKTLDQTGAGKMLNAEWAQEKESLENELVQVREAIKTATQERDTTMTKLLQEQQEEMKQSVERMRIEQEKLRVTMEQLHAERLAKMREMLEQQRDATESLNADLWEKERQRQLEQKRHEEEKLRNKELAAEQQKTIRDLTAKLSPAQAPSAAESPPRTPSVSGFESSALFDPIFDGCVIEKEESLSEEQKPAGTR